MMSKETEMTSWKAILKQKALVAQELLIRHRSKVEAATSMARAFNDLAISRSPAALIHGAFEAVGMLSKLNTNYAADYFSVKNRWAHIYDARMYGMFLPILKEFPRRSIKFENDNGDNGIFSLPMGEIAFLRGENHWKNETGLYYRGSSTTEAVSSFLVDALLKSINTKLIAARAGEDWDDPVMVFPEPCDYHSSSKLKELVAHIQHSFELGKNRSIMFYGPPGTGKSSLSQSLVKDLDLSTLVYKNTGSWNDRDNLVFLLKQFKSQAVILDDFDQILDTNQYLKVLELLNKQTKLVIGLANSMKDFHPALLRPGRFDELVLIDTIDEPIIKQVLGNLSKAYLKKVRKWPIAYINELVSRSKLYPKSELEKHFTELDGRVNRQLEDLGAKKRKTPKK
jgi:hypothetical protein